MTLADDAEFARMAELRLLEVEVAVLKAECAVSAAAVDDVELAIFLRQHPNSRLARIHAANQAAAQRIVSGNPQPLGTDYPEEAWCVEGAAYGWRRDYDEWPGWWNLVDRTATELVISHDAAARRLADVLNDPTAAAHLHAVRHERLTEILQGEPADVAPFELPMPVEELRFYVTAEGVEENELEADYLLRRMFRKAKGPR